MCVQKIILIFTTHTRTHTHTHTHTHNTLTHIHKQIQQKDIELRCAKPGKDIKRKIRNKKIIKYSFPTN